MKITQILIGLTFVTLVSISCHAMAGQPTQAELDQQNQPAAGQPAELNLLLEPFFIEPGPPIVNEEEQNDPTEATFEPFFF